jgi:hypothetical protein
VKVTNVIYDGFGWDIDDQGTVIFNMTPAVAEVVFSRQWRSWVMGDMEKDEYGDEKDIPF